MADLTAVERALWRRILKPPPELRDWIRKFGGYTKIAAEGWAEYNEAIKQWQEDRLASLQGHQDGARTPQQAFKRRSASAPAANETPPTDLLGSVPGQGKGQRHGLARRRRPQGSSPADSTTAVADKSVAEKENAIWKLG